MVHKLQNNSTLNHLKKKKMKRYC